ncbi:MAG: type IV pilus modification PilV family protein, partial [Candidatus Kryptoniota bacterium]
MKIAKGFILTKQASVSGEKIIPSDLSLLPAGKAISSSTRIGANGRARKGFTLIEVIVAMAILLIIVVSVLMLATVSAASLKDSEARDMAKNIATYTVEYIRSRNVTYPDNKLGHNDINEFGNDSSHSYPGLIDLWGIPLRPNGNSTSPYATINIHPALPSQTYNDNRYAFYYSLQGYVSLGDFSNLTTANPSLEDGNLYVCNASTKHYHDILTNNHIIMKFPLLFSDSDAIKNFTALSGYNNLIYTTDTAKTSKSSSEYDPHYTNDPNKKAGAMAYRGFRILTSIAARAKEDPNNPGNPSPHVQYY